MTYTPMTPTERRVVAEALAAQELELRRRRERGPWRDPELEAFLTGRGYAEKMARVEHRIDLLRRLL